MLLLIFSFVLLSFLPNLWGRKFVCSASYANSPQTTIRRQQFGFPIIFARRSISDIECAPADGREFGGDLHVTIRGFYLLAPDLQHEQYQNGYIIVVNLIADLILWAAVFCLLSRIPRSKSTKRKHGTKRDKDD